MSTYAVFGDSIYGDTIYGFTGGPQESSIKMETSTLFAQRIIAESNAIRTIGLTTRIEMVKG